LTSATGKSPAGSRPESLLTTRSNRRQALAYIVSLSGELRTARQQVRMRYMPDKLLVERSSFSNFLVSLDTAEFSAPEDLAFSILEEMNNEIVPRWIQIAVGNGDDNGPTETVTVEDCQPNWETPDLLRRLPTL
jgi:7-cyano-7-deazaguanine reductase